MSGMKPGRSGNAGWQVVSMAQCVALGATTKLAGLNAAPKGSFTCAARWHGHFKRGQEHMDFPPQLVDAMEAALGAGIAAGNVITVIGKLFARSEAGRLSDDPVALDYEAGAIRMENDPFATEQGDGVLAGIVDRDEIDKGVGFVRGQAHSAMMIAEFIEPGREAGKFLGATSHAGK